MNDLSTRKAFLSSLLATLMVSVLFFSSQGFFYKQKYYLDQNLSIHITIGEKNRPLIDFCKFSKPMVVEQGIMLHMTNMKKANLLLWEL